MNVFYTNENPLLAAEDHCKVHMRKMIVEYAQILSAAHHVLDQDRAIRGIYRLTHKNHPTAVWLRSGQYQYEWVLDCALHLCKMYTSDTGKIHKTQQILEKLQDLPRNIPLIDWQDPPVAAPDKFKALAVFNGSVFAYREYMKTKFKEWKERGKPIKVEFIHHPAWYEETIC